MQLHDFIEKANDYGKERIPFLFVIDFEMNFPYISKLSALNQDNVRYYIDGESNYDTGITKEHFLKDRQFNLNKLSVLPIETYKKAFDMVLRNQADGNSYLLNLTFKNRIKTDFSLSEIFSVSRSKYKLYFNHEGVEFVSFSPETFININRGKVYTYPVKGTISADIPNALEILLNDEKEKAEHLTVVDLLRNDLNIICKDVKVNKFFFIEEIKTGTGGLMQAYSEIEGVLKADFTNRFGDILFNLLPAGSICGAPKKKTLEIIREAEAGPRGYYTGVFGIFDGKNLKSSVLIRFIENSEGNYYYRSGGGITVYSEINKEYNEMLEKIYVPFY